MINKLKPPKASISRRHFINTVAATGGGLSLSSFIPKEEKVQKTKSKRSTRPNILLILTDQQHWNSIGALGNPFLKTPAQDRLVHEGVSIEKSYCTNPVSKPARSSLLTGRMPTETGVWLNTSNQPSGSKLDANMPNLGDWLKDKAGYDTIYAGKYHLSNTHTFDIQGFRVIAGGTDHRGDIGDIQVSRACEAYIRKFARDTRDDPFFMVCSFVQPHDVCHWLSIKQNTLEHPWYPGIEKVAPVPPLPHNFGIPDQEPLDINQLRSTQQPAQGNWNADQWRFYLWNYYRQVEMVDAEIGRVLTALEESGLAEDTLVVLTSDHGEGMAEQQMVRKGFLYESSVRVPLVARLPGVIPAGRILTRTLASGLDLMPTFCEYAGIDAPQGLTHALSLRGCWDGNEQKLRREALIIEENSGAMRGGRDPKRTARKAVSLDYSYTRYFNDPNELLFDMNADPGETKNLALNRAHYKIIDEYRNLIVDWESRLVISEHVPENPWKNTKWFN